ncbi:hypothetical protein [Sulfobacillus thermosulfidooxidans]|uniref:hypothetical protein n=1 Tax=Sulfobacillus thermosulfidooxidans TaxID=28034 RepID=UPI00031F7A6B|nr:hypothetical protein [Sulfobacillus thermosulfidooxidans]
MRTAQAEATILWEVLAPRLPELSSLPEYGPNCPVSRRLTAIQTHNPGSIPATSASL